MLRMCVLASGSSGNCIFVGTENTRILIDAGLSCRQVTQRLASIGVPLESIDAVCITHEHDDHKNGLGVLQRRANVALYANAGTIEAMEQDKRLQGLRWNVFATSNAFSIGDLTLDPFPVPHDSYDPVGFIVSSRTVRVGVVTDMGMPTTVIRSRLRDCAALVVEANHDEDLLKESPRPWSLKQRIGGRQGHLSNQQAGELLAAIRTPCLRTVFLAHLSSQCNRPALALRTVQAALAGGGGPEVELIMTYPDRPTVCLELA